MSILNPEEWNKSPAREKLSPSQLHELREIFTAWANAHKDKEEPYISLDNNSLTRLEMAQVLSEEDSPYHDAVLSIFEQGGFSGGFDEAFRQRIQLMRQEIEQLTASNSSTQENLL